MAKSNIEILCLGERLQEISIEDFKKEESEIPDDKTEDNKTEGNIAKDNKTEHKMTNDKEVVVLADITHASEALEIAGIRYDREVTADLAEYCRFETGQEYMAVFLCIPNYLDISDNRYKIMFFLNRRHIVILDEEGISKGIIQGICNRKIQQGETREQFLYNFFTQIVARDVERLSRYEQLIMALEESVMNEKMGEFKNEIMPVRRELLTLREYYDEWMDAGKEFEENENEFFAKTQLRYFGMIADRAERLKGRTMHLLEYAQQVRDAYQAQVEAEQNKNMQFLTAISTIFFPLTLITGWYGMNFKNMPELESGYAGVIVLSLIVLTICISYFKRKKMF